MRYKFTTPDDRIAALETTGKEQAEMIFSLTEIVRHICGQRIGGPSTLDALDALLRRSSKSLDSVALAGRTLTQSEANALIAATPPPSAEEIRRIKSRVRK